MKKIVAGLALAALATVTQMATAEAACLLTSRTTAKLAIYNQCVTIDLARERTIYIPRAIQKALMAGFHMGPHDVEAAALDAIVAGEADQHLSPSDISIVATADAPAAAAVNKWNAWVDGRALYSDYNADADDADGPAWSGLAGLDYKITPKFSAGLLLSADSSDLDGNLVDLESTSAGLGGYVGYVMTDNIVFSANLLRTWMDSSQSTGLGSLDFDTDRWQASAAVNGYWYSGTWRFNPALTLAWSKDFEYEKHGFSPDRTIETGVLTPSVQLGKTFRLSDTMSVEPWAGAAYDWTFLSDVHTAGFGTRSTPDSDLRLQAGLNFGIGSNAQLALTSEMGGLLEENLNSYSAEANLAIQF